MNELGLLSRPCIQLDEGPYCTLVAVSEYRKAQVDAAACRWSSLVPETPVDALTTEGCPRVVDREAYDEQMRRMLGLD
jgi:hypothetical protein